jgi:DNA-binding XRE family transcriptional regulator
LGVRLNQLVGVNVYFAPLRGAKHPNMVLGWDRVSVVPLVDDPNRNSHVSCELRAGRPLRNQGANICHAPHHDVCFVHSQVVYVSRISQKPSVPFSGRMARTPRLMSEINPERVALRLTALREALDLSRAQFADTVRINRSSYTLIEDGRKVLNHRMAYDISVRFGVSMDYIYKGQMSESDLPSNIAQSIRQRLMGQI